MQTLGFETVAELKTYFDGLGNGYLFRGQTKEYLNNEKKPSLSSSFSRRGCIPPVMLKLSHYGRKILQSFVKHFDDQRDLATDQAILQHYGWRSFFIDLTSNPAVAAWFAGHTYETQRLLNLAEDCWEDPAMLIHDQAIYADTEGTGVIYVVSKKSLRAKSVQAVDLQEIATAKGRPRFVVQSAWMVGPLKDELPAECISAKVFAPMSVLREWAQNAKLGSQIDLFPGPTDDPVLATLLALPWVHRPLEDDENQLHYFDRGLPLTEYGWQPVKRHPPHVVFYYSFWLANEHGEHSPFKDATYLLTDEATFYGVASNDQLRFPVLTTMLRTNGPLLIEMDGLMLYPHSTRSSEFGKGILISLEAESIVSVSEVLVDYAGMRPSGYGVAAGRSYQVSSDGTWVHAPAEHDCPCGNQAVHGHHLVVVSHIEDMLAGSAFKKVRPRIWATDGVNTSADLRYIKARDERAARYFADASA